MPCPSSTLSYLFSSRHWGLYSFPRAKWLDGLFAPARIPAQGICSSRPSL